MAYAPITVAKGGFVTKTPVRNRFGFVSPGFERHDGVASASGRARNCTLSQHPQIQRRGRAGNRASIPVGAALHRVLRMGEFMSTSHIHKPTVSARFAHVFFLLKVLLEAFADAQHEAAAAHKRYSFAEW